ncbi:MAG: polyprenyl synthetase family protein [Bryobacter sp.]|nr:polyprenyl synthetase family protein [Bryobacter sp.]
MTFAEYLAAGQQRVEAALDRWVPPENEPPESIHRAMRYSLFAGGKRIRPALAMAAAEAVGANPQTAVDAACALEMIHTYSLIHDDLPAMDDDDLRRGRPTCHKVFGEAIAILAGDALCTLAFQVLGQTSSWPPETRLRMIEELSRASGTVGGMIAGQVFDIEGENQPPEARLLERIHRAKTGAILRASLRMGALAAEADPAQFDALSRFGEHVGLAFQIVDDILDIEMPSEALGKTAGKDAAQNKITFPAVYGLAESKRMAESELAAAHAALEPFGDRAARLRELAGLIVYRKA